MQLAALSEVRRLGRREIRVDVYTYFWSGPTEGHTKGVTIAVTDNLFSAVDDIRYVRKPTVGALSGCLDRGFCLSQQTHGDKSDQDQKTRNKDTF